MISEENKGVTMKKTVEESNVAETKYKRELFVRKKKRSEQLKSQHDPD